MRKEKKDIIQKIIDYSVDREREKNLELMPHRLERVGLETITHTSGIRSTDYILSLEESRLKSPRKARKYIEDICSVISQGRQCGQLANIGTFNFKTNNSNLVKLLQTQAKKMYQENVKQREKVSRVRSKAFPTITIATTVLGLLAGTHVSLEYFPSGIQDDDLYQIAIAAFGTVFGLISGLGISYVFDSTYKYLANPKENPKVLSAMNRGKLIEDKLKGFQITKKIDDNEYVPSVLKDKWTNSLLD